MARKFKVKTKDSFTDKVLLFIGRAFKKRPQFINLNDGDMEKKCIIIANHNGAGGPFTYRTFMKKRFMEWGAHPMCEGYRSRWNYLYHIFYRQKLGWCKFRAFIVATFFGAIAGGIYRMAGIVPIYYDMRVKNTYQYSFMCLEKDVSVFIFPEKSDEGYKEIIDEFHPGFLALAKLYYKRYGADLPIYTSYYSKKPKQIVIGKPMYYQELLKEHSDGEILEIFRNYLNSLHPIATTNIEKQKKKYRVKSNDF